jgi:hypothetical protein
VDRVDLWLNARQGWSREVLTLVILAPMAVGVGLGGWAATGEAWWIPTPLALIVLGQLARRVLPRRGSRTAAYSRGTSWSPPEFSWRRMAGALLSIGSFSVLFITIGLDGSPAWHHWHRTFDLLYLIGMLGAGVLWFAEYRYMRRLRQLATQQPQLP